MGEGHSRGRVTSWRSVKGRGGGSTVLLCWSIQIDECGRSWRSGAVVEQRLLNQWFLRITHYAEGLLEGLSELEWPQGIKTMQEEWIGRSAGAYFDFSLEVSRQDVRGNPDLLYGPLLQDQRGETVRVFTTRPETVFGASYIAVATNHKLVSQLQVILLYTTKSGVVGGVWCGGRGLVWWEGSGVVGGIWCGGRGYPSLLLVAYRRTVV